MVTDYAQRKQRPRRSHKKIILTIIILLVAGFLPITMYYFRFQNVIHNKGKVLTTKITKKAKNTKPPQKVEGTTPQFDFYTLLPKMKVLVPKAKTTVPLQQSEKVVYVLQVAALKNRYDAKRLRDQLISMGYRAYVQSYQANRRIGYRVLAGPYISLNTAEKDQRQLHNKERLESLLLRRKTY